ncbi:MAG: HAD-IIIA family hydrolase [Acidobacteriia bacterium]|nr:HAD-IIIA family hydrolase [Terriglobia bacterium]
MKNRAVFLDRDGVINRYAYNGDLGIADTPANPDEFELLPGAGEAIAALNRLGLPVIVVSNQPGIAKGKLTPRLLDAINEEMRVRLAWSGARLDAVLYCRHHPEAAVAEYRADCDCRKPKPGLLLRAARERNIDLSKSFFIGDDVTDILAGRAAGVTTLLLSPHRCTVCEEFSSRGAIPDIVVRDLPQAATAISEMLAGGGSRKPAPLHETAPCVLAREDSTYTSRYLREAAEIIAKIDARQIERAAQLLRSVRERGGRLFLLGVGGGAGHASHAACDFRKIAGIEAYSVTDNVSELTARVNDEGWDTSYRNWLRASRLGSPDMIFVFSVGGGNIEKNISANLVSALRYARETGASITGVVGRDGGATAQLADVCVLVPVVNAETVTPHTESFQALIWHLLVSHPALKAAEMKWESVAAGAGSAPSPSRLESASSAATR